MKNIITAMVVSLLLAYSSVSYAETKDPVSASLYYTKGKIYQCVTDTGIHIKDKTIRDKVLNLTSRELFDEEMVRVITTSKSQFLKETITKSLILSARYEEGRNSVRGLLGKESFILINECKPLIPFIEKYILKKPIEQKPKDDTPLISSWDELENNNE